MLKEDAVKQSCLTIRENKKIASGIYRMILVGDASEAMRPGSFVNIRLQGRFLRRPISVCDADDSGLTIIYKVLVGGTRYMATLAPGTLLDVLSGLGNGFDISKSGSSPLLIGGGVGAPPMYMLAKRLINAGTKPSVILGSNTSAEVFYVDEFKTLGCAVTVTTADGSEGVKGFVTDAVPLDGYTFVYACGPEPMLRAVYKKTVTGGEFSFEERMGCGFGACMGCSCKTVTGYKRICRDGPVLDKEEILWED